MTDSSSIERVRLWRVAALAASFAILSSPTWLVHVRGQLPSFRLVTVMITVVIIAVVLTWKDLDPGTSRRPAAPTIIPMVAAVTASGVVLFAAHRWTAAVLWNPLDPNSGDMLIVIREAMKRLLRGHDPYSTYHVPWDASLGYGPVFWAPFLVAQALRVDLRLVAMVGELFVPICCAVVSVLEAHRSRYLSSTLWLVLLLAIAFDPDLAAFAIVGHTPSYWPLLPLFAMLVANAHWRAAALTLGVLVAARATMMAVVPVFFMAVWIRARSEILSSAIAWLAPAVGLMLPFFLWDPLAMWNGMVANYPRVVKEVVWKSSGPGGVNTVGATGWLLSLGLERFVELTQVCALIAVYFFAWRAIKRSANPLALMGLALFAFTATTLWPVYYLHLDVVLFFTSAAIVEAIGTVPLRRSLTLWSAALACVVLLVAATVRAAIPALPAVVVGEDVKPFLNHGFSASEGDAGLYYRWITGPYARILLPRSSAGPAELVITGQPFLPPGRPPQRVTAVLNGAMLGTLDAGGGWQALRFQAPRSAWWIGANELELFFAFAESPAEFGPNGDTRRLSMAIQRIDLHPR